MLPSSMPFHSLTDVVYANVRLLAGSSSFGFKVFIVNCISIDLLLIYSGLLMNILESIPLDTTVNVKNLKYILRGLVFD